MDTLTSFKTLKQIYWCEKDREREKRKTVKEQRKKRKQKMTTKIGQLILLVNLIRIYNFNI